MKIVFSVSMQEKKKKENSFNKTMLIASKSAKK